MQYVFKVIHCKGAGCVYISLENAFETSASLVHRNIRQQKKTLPGRRKVSVSSAELNENSTWVVILFSTWLRIMVLRSKSFEAIAYILVINHVRNGMIIQVITSAHGEPRVTGVQGRSVLIVP